MAIPSGFLDAIDVCLFILILGGFLGLTGGTGALEAGIAHVVRRFQGREMILIPILMFLFSIGGTTYGMAEETMAFYALITATMIAAGFDAMVGAAVILVGAGVGVLGSTVNPFAVSAAIDAIQGSGREIVIDQGIILLIGTVLWLICLAAGIWFVMRYAGPCQKAGTLHPLAGGASGITGDLRRSRGSQNRREKRKRRNHHSKRTTDPGTEGISDPLRYFLPDHGRQPDSMEKLRRYDL